jgi:hypothetical protein
MWHPLLSTVGRWLVAVQPNAEVHAVAPAARDLRSRAPYNRGASDWQAHVRSMARAWRAVVRQLSLNPGTLERKRDMPKKDNLQC